MSRDYEQLYQDDRKEQAEACRELASETLLHYPNQPWKALEYVLRNRNFENKRLVDRVAVLEQCVREWRSVKDGESLHFSLEELQKETSKLLGEE
jgi:hypothetical protein